MMHELKTWPEVFQDMWTGIKTFEYRKDDRHFAVGDVLRLREWSPLTCIYTGRELVVDVSYRVNGGQFGIPEGYCILGVRPSAPPTPAPSPEPGKDGQKVDDDMFICMNGRTGKCTVNCSRRICNPVNIPVPAPVEPAPAADVPCNAANCFYICDNCPGVSDVRPPCIITEKDYQSFADKDYCIGNGHGGAQWDKYVPATPTGGKA